MPNLISVLGRMKQLVANPFLCSTAVRRQSPGGRITRWALFAVSAYVAAFVGLLLLEDRLIFPAATIARPWLEPPDYLGVQEIDFPTAAGDRIHAWFSAPDDWSHRDGAALYSHGNGSNLSRLSGRSYRWRESLERAVLLYDYPGYGKSSGHPTEAGCYAAGEAGFQWLRQIQNVPASEIVLIGESMGGAIAVELAMRHTARLLVLEGAFTSAQTWPNPASRSSHVGMSCTAAWPTKPRSVGCGAPF